MWIRWGAAASRLLFPLKSGRGCSPARQPVPCSVGVHAIRCNSGSSQQNVGYFGWLKEVFSEERIKRRKESLRDELKRGYVNDFKELKTNQGKAFRASEKLADPQASIQFPAIELLSPSGKVYNKVNLLSISTLALPQ
eukprot:scaffold201984_cov46-Prasinocladus_malaysianus.AAC.1